jgi:8-amino-7-oxononanoate synthase
MPGLSGIAIVGMACRFPDAEDLPAYWRLLKEGRNAFRTPPADRWSHEAFYSSSQRTQDRYYVPTGAFLSDVRSFAALEFGIPPRRVEVMDPQQRITLEAAANALLDAGYGPGQRPLNRRKVGTCIGLSCTEYRSLMGSRVVAGMMAAGDLGDGVEDATAFGAAVSRVATSRPFSAAGALGNMTAACVAQELDLGGPAITVDAACASALVAVDDAVRWLRDGNVDYAIAGGTYLNLIPENLIAFSRIGAISAKGRCRPFDAQADGFVQGEGVGVVLLKRVEDAIRDGDRIYAVIRGSATNNDGRGDGPMSPRQTGQEEVIAMAWKDASVSAASIGYIEAHGTGTSVGDRTELNALRGQLGKPAAPIPIGSAKANIGHTMSAAGIAGLIKASLALHYRTIPPLAGWEQPHPDHGLDDGYFRVPTRAEPWQSTTPRHATVSSFGFGGTNGHVLLEEADIRPPTKLYAGLPSVGRDLNLLVTVSANTGSLLAQHLENLAQGLPDAGSLAAVAQRLNGEPARPLRLATVAASIEELQGRFRKAAARLLENPAFRGAVDKDTVIGEATDAAPIAMLCPGQGMQRVGLLRDWLSLPDFAGTLRKMEEEVSEILPKPLTDYLYAPDATEEALTDTSVAQPAMFAIGLAVAAVLRRFGVHPGVVLGHSLGEFTASALAGAVDPGEAIRFVAKRGQAMKALPGDHGAMAAVMATPEQIQPHLVPGVVLANYNHPQQSVISGSTPVVEATVAALSAAGLKAKKIPVSHAFHSPILSGIADEVETLVAEVQFQDPTLPMASCIAASAKKAGEIREIYRSHATSPVDYVRGLQSCVDSGARIFLQLCSGNTLTAFAKGSVEKAAAILSVGSDKEEGLIGLYRALGQAWVLGHPVERAAFGEGLALLPPTPRPAEVYWAVGTEPARGPALATVKREVVSTVSESPAKQAETRDTSAVVSSEDDLSARVLKVVSKISAFPVEALNPRQRLLEDLGFDSLMLNELNKGLTDGFPGFPGLPRSLFASSPTVADLVRHIEAPAAAVALSDSSRPMLCYQPVLREAPLCGRKRSPARVLHHPSLADLRALAPQDLVVLLPGHLLGNDPAVGALAGFTKSLAREWPQHKVVALEGSQEEAEIEASAIERDAEVIWRGGQRYVVGLEPVSGETVELKGKKVLLTGGTGWLGRRLAKSLIEKGAEILLLGSRVDPGDALAELGAAARYLRVDLTSDLSGLHGLSPDLIVHAAGLLADGKVGTADGSKAFQVKVEGLQKLAAFFPDTPIVALGSYAGRFGNALQTEYGAANEAMTCLGRSLDRAERRVLTQVWGPWEGSEMVEKIPAPLRAAMREEGLWFVHVERGLEAFVGNLGLRGEVVLGLDLPAVRRVWEEEVELRPEATWLQDHALFGKPTVPMAMVLEWATQLGGNDVRNLTLYSGLVVNEPMRLRLRVENGKFTAKVGEKLAWSAEVGPVEGELVAPTQPTGGEKPPLALSEFYSRHTFHGPLLQGIVRIEALGDEHVVGVVRSGDAAAWGQAPWKLGPLAVDSALQLAAYWARVRRDRAGFPIRLGRWRQVDVPANSELRATLSFTSSTADRFVGLLTLQDLDGRVVAIGEGVEAEFRSDGPALPEVAEEHYNFEKFPAWEDLSQRLSMAEAMGLTSPYFKLLDGTARDTVTIGGRELLHFSGYNYLGFSGHPEVERRVQEAVSRYGTSVSASRVASGDRPIHRELEQKIAAALGVEDAVVFTAGHATNVTTIGHLFGPKDLILHDELIHDSIFQGMRLSGATRRPFPHGDLRALARMLEQLRGHYEKCLIVVEGVYSMDGDTCDLPTLVQLKQRHRCFLMVDEAHSFGVLGERGYGVSEHYGISGKNVDIWMGTLSKSLSSCGGYIAGSSVLVTLLKYTAPGFIYSAGLTPANTMAAIASLDLMARDNSAVKKLQGNGQFFYKACKEAGLDLGPALGESGVIPVITGNSYHALLLSDALFKRGINVQPILYPAVADNAARLRFFLSALHSEEQLGWTATVVAEELGRIRVENPM